MRSKLSAALILTSAFALSGCLAEPLTTSEIAKLDPTPVSDMPTGTASYTGEIVYEYSSDDGTSGVVTGDYQLEADFDNSSVTNSATNIVAQDYENGVETEYSETIGTLTGSGFIVDNSFAANLSGELTTVRYGTTPDDAEDLDFADQVVSAVDVSTSGQFVGAGAKAIYGKDETTSQDGSLYQSVTVAGNKD